MKLLSIHMYMQYYSLIPMYTGILNEPLGRNTRKSPRKPHKEESISSVEVNTRTNNLRAWEQKFCTVHYLISFMQWLSKYGLKSLGLSFSQVEVDRTSPPVRCHRTSYKHVNKKVSYAMS